MSSISDYHQYLFLGKLTNTLDEEEQRQLQELFADNPDAEQAYKELLSQLPHQNVANSFGELNMPGFWKNVTGEIRRDQIKTNRSRILKIVSAAVIVGGLIWTGAFLYNDNNDSSSKEVLVNSIKEKQSIELKLANGKTIDLSNTKGNINQGDLILDNTNNSLSYRVTENNLPGMNTVHVPAGMDYKINLSDGSEVWINSATVLQFPSQFARDKREISISGEAYLKISKDTKRRFTVHLPKSTIVVTGTEFNVNTYSPSIEKVSLVEGRILMSTNNSTMPINPGFEGVLDSIGTYSRAFDSEKVLSWRKGLFYFEKANLEELSLVLSRWYGIKTKVDRPALVSKKFAGVLDKTRPINVFLDNLKAISKIEYFFDNDGVLHFK